MTLQAMLTPVEMLIIIQAAEAIIARKSVSLNMKLMAFSFLRTFG